MQQEIIRNRFSDDEINFLFIKKIDKILLFEKSLSKEEIVEDLRNLRDELDRWC
jgi:hypothetical protein